VKKNPPLNQALPHTHDLIFEEYIALGTQVSNGMTSLKDKASAENFKTIIESAPEKLEALLERTTQIDSPTDEQKAAFKNTNEELEQKMQTAGMEMAKNMQTNPPSPEDMAAIGTIMQEVMGGEIGKKMEELTDKIDAFYDLK